MLKLNLADGRAKWATERELESIRQFCRTIERLIEAVGHFRVQQAWDNLDKDSNDAPPSWVKSYSVARGAVEEAMHAASSEKIFLDDDIQTNFDKAVESYMKWFLAFKSEDGVTALVALENELFEFKKLLAQKYRAVFDERKAGVDLGLKE